MKVESRIPRTESTSHSSGDSAVCTSQDRMAAYRHRTSGITDQERDEVIPALALRSYHLPGNTWCEDWSQFLLNNHPLWGICCHHRLHPVKSPFRIVNLLGSICFGLAVTNLIWLWLIADDRRDADQVVISIAVGDGGETQVNQTASATNTTSTSLFPDGQIDITEGMVFLWTVGGGLHALFDNTIWYITACVCCLPGQKLECLYKYKWCGTYLVIFSVVLVTAVASFVVVFRASLDEDQDLEIADLKSAGIFDDQIELGRNIDKSERWEFLMSYAVELGLALVVYHPLVATLFFSGVLGCGRIPILGGRPYELARERRKAHRQAPTSQTSTARTSTARSSTHIEKERGR